MKTKFIIKGPVVDGEELYWSNENGWVAKGSATVFDIHEKINEPIHSSGRVFLNKYRVVISHIVYESWVVDAENEEHARESVMEGNGIEETDARVYKNTDVESVEEVK